MFMPVRAKGRACAFVRWGTPTCACGGTQTCVSTYMCAQACVCVDGDNVCLSLPQFHGSVKIHWEEQKHGTLREKLTLVAFLLQFPTAKPRTHSCIGGTLRLLRRAGESQAGGGHCLQRSPWGCSAGPEHSPLAPTQSPAWLQGCPSSRFYLLS